MACCFCELWTKTHEVQMESTWVNLSAGKCTFFQTLLWTPWIQLPHNGEETSNLNISVNFPSVKTPYVLALANTIHLPISRTPWQNWSFKQWKRTVLFYIIGNCTCAHHIHFFRATHPSHSTNKAHTHMQCISHTTWPHCTCSCQAVELT